MFEVDEDAVVAGDSRKEYDLIAGDESDAECLGAIESEAGQSPQRSRSILISLPCRYDPQPRFGANCSGAFYAQGRSKTLNTAK